MEDSRANHRVITQAFENIDEQAECLTGYNQKYQQLSTGQFHGRFSTALMGRELGLYFEQLNQVLDQTGSAPPDQYSVLLMMNKDLPCKLNGSNFSSDDLFLMHPGSSYHTLSRSGTHFCVVSIEKHCFEALLRAERGDGKTGFENRREGILKTNRSNTCQLRHAIKSAVLFLEQPAEIKTNPRAYSALRTSLCDMLSNTASQATLRDVNERELSRPNHLYTVRKARDFIHENIDKDISIAQLCYSVGVGRRTLEYSFKVCMEHSPAAYLRIVRLNEIRRALQLPENSGRSIGDIAAQWGVWHESRFAQYYRHQFGELPSHTRDQLQNI